MIPPVRMSDNIPYLIYLIFNDTCHHFRTKCASHYSSRYFFIVPYCAQLVNVSTALFLYFPQRIYKSIMGKNKTTALKMQRKKPLKTANCALTFTEIYVKIISYSSEDVAIHNAALDKMS